MFPSNKHRIFLSILIALFVFMLAACGGGDGGDSNGVVPDMAPERPEPMPEPEIESPIQKPAELPALPLLSESHATQAPIILRGEVTHVGASLGSSSGGWIAQHGEMAVSYNGMLGGLSIDGLIDYLITDAQPYDRIKRWDSPPSIYLAADATPQMISDAVFAMQIINSFLPNDWQLQFGSPDFPSEDRITIYFQDAGLSGRGVGGTTNLSYDATLEVIGANVYVLPDLWTDSTEYRDPQHRIYLLAHELLHALGRQHADPNRDMSQIASLTIMDPSARGSSGFVLFPVDREALNAIYGELEVGESVNDIAERLGDWDDTGVLLRGDFDIPEGDGSFGVSLRNGLARPWAAGPTPWTLPADNPIFSETVTWEGRLLGFTPAAEPVAGSASLGVDISTFSGDLDFNNLESWVANGPPRAIGTGQQWGGGVLSYDVGIRDNTFTQTGGDEGTVTGIFFGPQHEGMGGVLERDDLTAAFGGQR